MAKYEQNHLPDFSGINWMNQMMAWLSTKHPSGLLKIEF